MTAHGAARRGQRIRAASSLAPARAAAGRLTRHACGPDQRQEPWC